MDANEDVPNPSFISTGATAVEAGRPGLTWSLWRSIKAGLKWSFIVVALILATPLLVGLALTVYGFGAGRGLVMPSIQPDVFGFTLTCGMLALIPICAIGLVVVLASFVLSGARNKAPTASQRIRWSWLVIGLVLALLAASYWFRSYRGGIGLVVALVIRYLIRARPPALFAFYRRHWPWLIGTWVFLVLATAYGIGAFIGGAVDYQYAKEVAAAERDDPFWRLDALMAHREKVPDSENSALIVKKVLALLPKDWPGRIPQVGEPPTSLRESLKIFYGSDPRPENVRLDDDVADEFRREAKTFNEAVHFARTIADYRRGRHELKIGPAVIDTSVEETAKARDVAFLLAADAEVRCRDNDPDGARIVSRHHRSLPLNR